MAQKKRNLKQQKQKQKQHQKQQVIVNVITSKKRRSTKKTKGSSSHQQPLIQSLPIQYTPYTMYDTARLLTEANMRSLVPTQAPVPLVQEATNNNINVEELRNVREKYYRLGGGEFLENPNNQSPSVNDILDNVVENPIITGADANEGNEIKKIPSSRSISCSCGGTYRNTEPDFTRHQNTNIHKKYEERINKLLSSNKK